MGFASGGLSAAQMLAALSDDGNKLKQPIGMLDFWGNPDPGITLTTTPGDKTLGDVVIPDLGTYTIVKAYAMMRILEMEDSSSASNYLGALTHIQIDKAAAGYINAIEMNTQTIEIDADFSHTLFFEIIGDIDVSSRVANNATSNFKWTGAAAQGNNLSLRGLQTGIRLIVTG